MPFSSELVCVILNNAFKKEVNLNEILSSNNGVPKLQVLWYVIPQKIFLFSKISRLALGFTQTAIQLVPGIPFLGCKEAME